MADEVATMDRRAALVRLEAVLGGPIWWAMHLAAMYWWVPRACNYGHHWPFHLVTVVLFAACIRAAFFGRQLVREGRVGDSVAAPRDVVLGWLGILLGLFFAAVVIAEAIPVLLIDPCA